MENAPCFDILQAKDFCATVDARSVEGTMTIENQEIKLISNEEFEKLQREANEESGNSEDLKRFLEDSHQGEMHQHLHQQQQLQVSFTSGNSGTRRQLQRHAAGDKQRLSVLGPDQVNTIDSLRDDGWGWVVVFSSLVCMILVEGLCLSYGLLVAPACPGNSYQAVLVDSPEQAKARLVAISLGVVFPSKAPTMPIRPGTCIGVSELGEELSTQSRMILMSPGGTLMGTYLLLGPFASALSNRFELRSVVMTGAVVSAIGLFSAAFSTSMAMLNATLGVIGGIGFGLIYLPAIEAVGPWFLRKRTLAVGVALCGCAVGSIVWGLVLPLLIHWVTWRGTLILLAAFCLQSLVVMTLFRRLDIHLLIWGASAQRKQPKLNDEAQRRRRLAREEMERVRRTTLARKRSKAYETPLRYGLIISRSCKEKRRQRALSVGSLDGMVITSDNRLVAASSVTDSQPLFSSVSIACIADSAMRKLETRLSDVKECDSEEVGGDSKAVQPSLSSSLSVASPSRELPCLNLVRQNLPQLVLNYVRSQASMVMKDCATGQHPTVSGHVVAASSAVDLNSDSFSNSRNQSVVKATGIYPVAAECNAWQTQCPSLRRAVSEVSLTSSKRGVQIPRETFEKVTELLNEEIGAEVHHQLRRQMMRGCAQQRYDTQEHANLVGEVGDFGTTPGHASSSINKPPSTSNATVYAHGICPETDGNATVGILSATAIVDDVMPCIISSAKNIPNQTQNLPLLSCKTPLTRQSPLAATSHNEEAEDFKPMNSGMKKESTSLGLFWAHLKELLSPGLLHSPTFICLLLSNAFAVWGTIIPYFTMPDLMAESNWTLSAAGYAIAFIGYINLVGRLSAMFFIEKDCFRECKWDSLCVNVAFLILCGLACLIIPLVGYNYRGVIAAGSFFGIFTGVTVSLKRVIVVELFGLEKLTNALSYMLLSQGVASMVGTAIGGYVFDVMTAGAPEFMPSTSSDVPLVYAAEACFHFAGASFFIAALFAVPLRRLAALESRWARCSASVLPTGGDAKTITSETAVNLAQSLQDPFLFGIPSHTREPKVVKVMATAIQETAEPPPPSIPDPSNFLSPAPLPSSRFITSGQTWAQGYGHIQATTDRGSLGIDSSVGIALMDDKTAAVEKICETSMADPNLKARRQFGNMIPFILSDSHQCYPDETGIALIIPTFDGREKSNLIAEEPALEPVKEEEEEEVEEDPLKSRNRPA